MEDEITANVSDREDLLSAYFKKLHGDGKFSGSVLYSVDGRVLFKAGYGYSDQQSGRGNSPGTAYQIASVSKQFTAASIMLLEEEGKLSVRDSVVDWLPGSSSMWKHITIHHLLTHTSGLPHWRDIPSLDLFNPVEEEKIVAAFSSCQLRFPPGKGWYYSSPGYHLLALIAQDASGQKFHDFLKSRIFGPLEMTKTSAGTPLDLGLSATGYDDSGPVKSFDLSTTGLGAGDVWSTVEDLALWDSAVSQPGKILSRRSLDATFRPQASLTEENLGRFAPMTEMAYGYGWFLGLLGNEAIRFHTGDNPGYRAVNAWKTDSNTVLCILSNLYSAEVGEMAVDLLGKMDPTSSP